MEKQLVEIVFIIDKSGSMQGLEKDTIGGFNSFIENEKKKGITSLVTTILFDTNNSFLHQRESLEKVNPMTENDYRAFGCTALLDAMGLAINYIKEAQEKDDVDNKPTKTVFVITTDGLENSSREYSYKQIKNLVNKTQKELDYEYIFLAANIDSFGEAERIGIDNKHTAQYECNSDGIVNHYKCIQRALDSIISDGCLDEEWKIEVECTKKKSKK